MNTRLTILLVDDEAELRDLIAEALAAAGYEVLCAGGIEEAREQFAARNGDIDLLLTDVGLGDGSGHDLCALLRSLQSRLPVLFMSGDPDAHADTANALEAFIVKPFLLSGIVSRIRRLLAPPHVPRARWHMGRRVTCGWHTETPMNGSSTT